jgi:mannose-6-phosphate isomerase-like protein (cupin superfamily)
MPSPYTFKKLAEVEDAAPGFGIGEHQESRFAARDLDAEQTGVAYHRFRPGKRQGFAHRHEAVEEVYVVIRGSGRMKLGDDIIELEPLDAIRVSPEVTRQFEAGPDGIEVLAFGPRRADDGEAVHGWWTD